MRPEPKHKQIVKLFDCNRKIKVNTYEITQHLLDTYDYSYKILRKGWTLEKTVKGEVSDVLSRFYCNRKGYEHLKAIQNFVRELIDGKYYYSHKEYECNIVLPMQTTLDLFQEDTIVETQIDEIDQIDENKDSTNNSQLFEDIKALNKINDLDKIIDLNKIKEEYLLIPKMNIIDISINSPITKTITVAN